MNIYLPPGAHLKSARETLNAVADVLEQALRPARRFQRSFVGTENELRIAVAFHGLAALDAARAVHAVSGTDFAGTISMDFRTVFECLVKIRWMRADPRRARAYLESEPFERYVLATPRVKRSQRWASVVTACKEAVAKNPSLLKLPSAVTGSNNRPDFKAIAKGLRMPSLHEMAKRIGMDDDDVLVDSDVPSLTPHTSVIYTKNFAKSSNRDGTFNISTAVDPTMLTGYVARTATRTGEVLQEILHVFPDGAVQYEAEEVAKRMSEFVTSLKGYIQ